MILRTLTHATIAIALATLAGAGAQAAPSKVHALCLADSQKLCPDAKAGRGAVMRCVKTRLDAVSADCRSAVAAAQELRAQRRAARLAAAKGPANTAH